MPSQRQIAIKGYGRLFSKLAKRAALHYIEQMISNYNVLTIKFSAEIVRRTRYNERLKVFDDQLIGHSGIYWTTNRQVLIEWRVCLLIYDWMFLGGWTELNDLDIRKDSNYWIQSTYWIWIFGSSFYMVKHWKYCQYIVTVSTVYWYTRSSIIILENKNVISFSIN